MSDTYEVPEHTHAGAAGPIDSMDRWREHWNAAKNDPSGYFLDMAKRTMRWRNDPTVGLEGDFRSVKDEPLRWFADGTLNITETCIDRHAEERPDAVAILHEGDEPGDVTRITYSQLRERVSRVSNVLADNGIQKGDRVIIYMGMVPEAAIAMLACARVGAIHSVVFGGFSAEAVRDRVRDCGAEMVITQDESRRGGKQVPLKATVDRALEGEVGVRHVLVFEHTGADVGMVGGRDIGWKAAEAAASPEFTPAEMHAEDPLFILYTSGSTGKPKGLVHTCAGYLLWTSFTHRTVFDLRPDDVFACMADVGWVTGHSYIVYGPLANGATTLMFESTPLYPDAGRYWDIVERLGVTIFYTAPTALRTLAAENDKLVTDRDLSSLRVLGSVGEPIDPETWRWYYNVVGQSRCNIVDTWWQTETGGICLSPIAPATPTRPGSATFPLPGVQPLIVDQEGHEQHGPAEGYLCLRYPWPGLARTVYGDHQRYFSTYFSTYPGLYFAGDGCKRDADGYHWITGRVDDVVNVSGHRMGTAEFESAIVSLDAVAESAVVGFPHPIKGQGVYVYVVVAEGVEANDELSAEIQKNVRDQIGAHAKLDAIQYVRGLPKTRSGKCMRRILRKIAEGRSDELGDTSTLADPEVVDEIVDGYGA